jgi:hypothetical protein
MLLNFAAGELAVADGEYILSFDLSGSVFLQNN